MKQEFKYPTFVKTKAYDGGKIMAFLRPDLMFCLDLSSFGKGYGFAFRIFKTRQTCRKYETEYNQISYAQFVAECKNILGSHLIELSEFLPKAPEKLPEDGSQKLINPAQATTTPTA